MMIGKHKLIQLLAESQVRAVSPGELTTLEMIEQLESRLGALRLSLQMGTEEGKEEEEETSIATTSCTITTVPSNIPASQQEPQEHTSNGSGQNHPNLVETEDEESGSDGQEDELAEQVIVVNQPEENDHLLIMTLDTIRTIPRIIHESDMEMQIQALLRHELGFDVYRASLAINETTGDVIPIGFGFILVTVVPRSKAPARYVQKKKYIAYESKGGWTWDTTSRGPPFGCCICGERHWNYQCTLASNVVAGIVPQHITGPLRERIEYV